VNAVLYADRAPERAWQAQQAAYANQTKEINQLQSEASTLTDQLNALVDATGALSSVTASSGDTSVFYASAVAGTATGNHSVFVNNLATNASAYTAEVATKTTQLGTGAITITPTASGTATTIQVGTGDGTADNLTELAATINSKSLGLTASVITDANGSRLSLVANSSGSAAGFTASSTVTGLGITQPNTAIGTNASLDVDGIPISSASNTVTGAISGVTLYLTGASTGSSAASLTLAPDTSAIQSAISDVVTSYNTLITDVNSQFNYNSATQTGGALETDSVLQNFQSDVFNAANYTLGVTATISSLSSLGITTNSDGTLTLDSSALGTAVVNNLSAVQTFFQGTNSNGFVSSLESTLNTYTDSTQGAFTVELSSISSENADLTSQTDTLEAYLATVQTSLTTEYNTADIALAQLPQTLKQINALLNPNSSSS
jgi:flagellar hook-associated protein 2